MASPDPPLTVPSEPKRRIGAAVREEPHHHAPRLAAPANGFRPDRAGSHDLAVRLDDHVVDRRSRVEQWGADAHGGDTGFTEAHVGGAAGGQTDERHATRKWCTAGHDDRAIGTDRERIHVRLPGERSPRHAPRAEARVELTRAREPHHHRVAGLRVRSAYCVAADQDAPVGLHAQRQRNEAQALDGGHHLATIPERPIERPRPLRRGRRSGSAEQREGDGDRAGACPEPRRGMPA
jgi:hypothetical protein